MNADRLPAPRADSAPARHTPRRYYERWTFACGRSDPYQVIDDPRGHPRPVGYRLSFHPCLDEVELFLGGTVVACRLLRRSFDGGFDMESLATSTTR